MKNLLQNKTLLWRGLFFFLILLHAGVSKAQNEVLTKEKNTRVVNRMVSFKDDIYLKEAAGDGFLQIKDLVFKNGTIEADIKGSNTPQHSFVGIAFHGQDSRTYDVIYFRPFNFLNPERKTHSVQYIAHPTYTWDKLRAENPGKYEAALQETVDPDEWFHVRIEVDFPHVTVYVNAQQTASLAVRQLSKGKAGWLGFWVGNMSDGHFKNLRITPAEK